MTTIADIWRSIALVFLRANRLSAFRYRARRWLASKRAGRRAEYLKEENSVLREQLGDKRILFTDAQVVASRDVARLSAVMAFAN